jgi:hypothetical protein
MAVLRSGPWQVFLNYGQLSANHAQPEALNTEVYYDEIPISIDPGTVRYGSTLHKGYFSQAISENVALIDGAGQEGINAGRMVNFDAAGASLSASQPRYRHDASSQREIFFSGAELVDRLSVQLDPGIAGTRRLGFAFHTGCEVIPAEATTGPAQPADAPAGDGFSYWREVTLRTPITNWEARLNCGKQTFTARFDVGGAHRAYIAKAPSTPFPTMRNVVYVELPGREATLEMRLSPAPDKVPLAAELGSHR